MALAGVAASGVSSTAVGLHTEGLKIEVVHEGFVLEQVVRGSGRLHKGLLHARIAKQVVDPFLTLKAASPTADCGHLGELAIWEQSIIVGR